MNTSIMLFLNKKDVFAEKILYSNIAAQRPFDNYVGPPKDFDQGILYFIQKFKDCLIEEEFNDSFIHVTCATDTNNSKFLGRRVNYVPTRIVPPTLAHVLLQCFCSGVCA